MAEDQILSTDILKIGVAVGASIFLFDGIEYEGKVWLVPEWLDSPDGQWCKPKRIICVTNLRHQDLRDRKVRSADLSVIEPMPKEILDGKIAELPNSKYIVVELPSFRIQKPKIH
jgi:hypothetical protein